MKPSFRSARRLVFLGLFAAGGAWSAPTPVSDAATTAELGRINGVALACAQPELVTRTKALVIARIAKTRELGEVFESATNQAFAEQTGNKAACPPRGELALRLEAVAMRLGPVLTHRLDDSAVTPEVGLNPRYLLQAANGRAVMDGDFRNQFQLVTFGYTSCPDVCPTTLVDMADILKRLDQGEALASKLQPIFISVDPERDTLAVLREYTAYFDKRILGATGSPDLLKRAAESFKARYEKVPDAGGRYAVDHSAGMFLLAPGGQFIAKFAYGTPAADIAERIRGEIKRRAATAEAAPAAAAAAK